MRRILLLAVFFIASNAGCASIGVRTGAYESMLPVYPATVVDVGIVSYGVAKPFIPRDPTAELDAQESLIYLFIPAAIVDFPVAIAVDTIFLPLDLYKLCAKIVDRDHSDDAPLTDRNLDSNSIRTSTRWADIEKE